MARCSLIAIVALLVCSCGESESEALARETRERVAAQEQAAEEEKQLIQERLDELKQGDEISMGDLLAPAAPAAQEGN